MRIRARHILTVSAVLASACFMLSRTSPPHPRDDGAANPSSPTDAYAQVISGLYAELSPEELCAASDLVCRATYRTASAPFLVRPVSGSDPMFFTDYYFDVEQVYKGALAAEMPDEKKLTVRQRGGSGRYLTVIDDDALKPVAGEEYLLFLYSIPNGADYNTVGSHYYLSANAEQSAWNTESDDAYRRPDTGAVLTSAELVALVADSPSEDDSDVNRTQARLEEVRRQLDSGEISREYYDDLVEKLRLEETGYAQILSDEETRSYEEQIAASSGGGAVMGVAS